MIFNKLKSKFFLIGFFAFFILGGLIFFANGRYFRIVGINGKKFIARLALDAKSQAQGLGGRRKICRSCALLFSFKEKGKYSFWMKNMNFNLDIIWISGNQIVYIKKNFLHNSEEIAAPDLEADNVLEINAGLVEKYGFEIGDKVRIY